MTIIYDNSIGTRVEAVHMLTFSNTDVTGHWYDLTAPGYFAQLLFQRGDGTKQQENGVTTEAVLAALIHRVEHLDSLLPCAENKLALSHLKGAAEALEDRLRVRAEQGVLGTSEPHESELYHEVAEVAADELAAEAAEVDTAQPRRGRRAAQ